MATPDRPQTIEDVRALVEEHGIRFIRLWFTDILGQLKSFSINSTELEDAFEGGMGFDGSVDHRLQRDRGVRHDRGAGSGDVRDPAVAAGGQRRGPHVRRHPDARAPALRGRPEARAARALDRMRTMGFDDFYVGPELEYFLFKDSRSTEPLDQGGYFDLTTLDAGSDVRRETVLALERFGIEVEYSHHEVGPSQHEIDMRYAPALKMADDCMTYRITVKEYALKYGWHATFMPKPLFGHNGSGMHTHQSLFKGGRNAFYDADDKYFLSDTGKAFIAGSCATPARSARSSPSG
jgi:glutamine synthetase